MYYLRSIIYLLTAAVLSTSAWPGSFDEFFRAVRTNNAGAVAELLQRGFDPNTHEPSGQSALGLAIREGSDQVVEALLKHPQLDVDATNSAGETPLMLASIKGSMDLVQRLLARGAAVSHEGWNPLHYAATGPEPPIVALLLERGAPIDARSPNGSTALMMAARYGSEQSVALLLERQADAVLRNDRGLNAADFARSVGREALAKRLESRAR